MESISEKMKGVQKVIFAGLNKLLEEGIETPLPEYFKKDFKQSMLVPFDHYLLVEADPDVHKYMGNID